MARSFDVSFESTATVGQVHSTFADEQYWRARIAAFDASITLDCFNVDPDGKVAVVTTQDLRQGALPGPLAKVYPGDLIIRRSEIWTPVSPDRVDGDIDVAATGAPVSGRGTALLTSVATGSRLTLTGSVQFRMPLVGGAIESFLAGQLTEGVADIQNFTTNWISGRA
jgi:hypothetical protein